MTFYGHDLDKLEERARDLLEVLGEFDSDPSFDICALTLALVKIADNDELDLVVRMMDDLQEMYVDPEEETDDTI